VFVSGLDIGIMEEVSKHPGIGIMELREELDVAHNSLKPHVDSLVNMNIIIAEPQENSRKIELKINPEHQKEVKFLIEKYKDKEDKKD
jgi:DNA-binding MarR family transcriptional regulator